MSGSVRLPAVLCAALLLGAGGFPGTTLYVNRVVVAPTGNVSLGALVRSADPVSPAAQEALFRTATVLGDTVQYLPLSQYQPQLDDAFGTDAIVVGSWSVIAARGTSAEGEGYLLGRLADYLIAQNLLSDSRVDMSFTLIALKGNAPHDGEPVFGTIRTGRGVEVSFSLAGSDGSSVSGRVVLPPPPAPDPSRMVRSNTPVQVVLRRGIVTVEMPGRALSSASVGDSVNVYVPDTQKTFTGRMLEGKAVEVDLP